MKDIANNNIPLLTYRDAAKLLHVTDRTVWQLVKDGALPAVRFRRTVRIDPADLQSFIDRAKGRVVIDAAQDVRRDLSHTAS